MGIENHGPFPGKANVDKSVIQFACSLGRVVLYALLIFNIAVSLGVTESSVSGPAWNFTV